jgi:hypothetical protein
MLLALFFLFVGPIAIIWSLNVLFPVLNIPLTLETWMAVFILNGTAITINQRS